MSRYAASTGVPSDRSRAEIERTLVRYGTADEFEHIGLITREHAIAAAQNAMRNQGYAVAVHGSRVRDLDLIAVPWTEETALTPRMVADIIATAIPGVITGAPEKKPHGRVGFVIRPRVSWGFDTWYIDLSVMPRKRRRTALEAGA